MTATQAEARRREPTLLGRRVDRLDHWYDANREGNTNTKSLSAFRAKIAEHRNISFRNESTFEVGRRFRCTMRIDCGQLDPGAVIRPEPGEWHPRMPERLDQEELADWRAGRNAVYQLAALTIGARLAVADA